MIHVNDIDGVQFDLNLEGSEGHSVPCKISTPFVISITLKNIIVKVFQYFN